MISLPCDNSSGNLEAVDLPKGGGGGGFFLWLRRAKALNLGLLSQCNLCVPQGFPNSAARQPLLAARLQSYVCMHSKSSCSAHCLSPHISPSFPFKSSHPGRSCCTAEELRWQGARGMYWDFRSCYSDLGSCLSSFSIPGSQPEKKS